eukprot:gene16553-5875_t
MLAHLALEQGQRSVPLCAPTLRQELGAGRRAGSPLKLARALSRAMATSFAAGLRGGRRARIGGRGSVGTNAS